MNSHNGFNVNFIIANHLHLSSLAIKLLLSLLLLLLEQSLCLNIDGVSLLSFKYSILNDPLHVLDSWNYNDTNPCSWRGVTCSQNRIGTNRVTSLSLPNSQLLGSIPSDLCSIDTLQYLNLSSNALNGSLPSTLFNATALRVIDLSNNMFSGNLSSIDTSIVEGLNSLQVLGLSNNLLSGSIPSALSILSNLTAVSLNNNYLSGEIPGGFDSVWVFDISSNLFNGSLPQNVGGGSLWYLNISYNNLSGQIPPDFGSNIPPNATIDLSFNNLTGEIPDSPAFSSQKTESFAGNQGLCSVMIRKPCPIPSSPAYPPNASSPTSSPAIAAIFPKSTNPISPEGSSSSSSAQGSGFRYATIIGIVLGDIAGVAVLSFVFFYAYNIVKKQKTNQKSLSLSKKDTATTIKDSWSSPSTPSTSDSIGFARWSCLRRTTDHEDESETSSTTDTEVTHQAEEKHEEHRDQAGKKGTLVTFDGEKELELETLLKASAYILGASGSSITYKAVLEDGTPLAVRRIGENHVERFKDFESQVRVVAKVVHPNLVRIRGFYWGVEDKLIIYDFACNGSLANTRYNRKMGSSPAYLTWEARVRIAKGVARGLSFLHDKKQVHGNLKPSNILLGADMEPRIGDFGLKLVIGGDTSYKVGASARNFGSKRSTTSRDSLQDFSLGPSPSPSPSPSTIGGLSPYHAPESLRTLKPNPKWDVYSFGVILLELLTGKVIVVDEMGQANNGLAVEDTNRALRMADVAIRADVEGKEDALLACFKLGYSCASPVPQKRPSMKEVLQVLENF